MKDCSFSLGREGLTGPKSRVSGLAFAALHAYIWGASPGDAHQSHSNPKIPPNDQRRCT
jgi:hypothetical protein